LSGGRNRRTERELIEDRLGTRARVFGSERAVLVGIDPGGGGSGETEASMRELASLADTAGIPTLATVLQKRKKPDPGTFLGKGKVEEVRRAADELAADVVIFNDELSPAQARNLEEALSRKVIDRTQLIMDIFAQRAATKEAKLQVELAQLRYLLPRLRGWGTALTRTGGGIGTRGPGETQLELDRFKVNRRIQALERRLEKSLAERSIRRKRRTKSDLPQVALVGYTNSGKSTLLNCLCATAAVVEDKLFATLDTMVRRGVIARGRVALFVDTVGFIRDLPHDLVPAFAATLEAVRYADLILHVIDRSAGSWEKDRRVVLEILEREVFRQEDDRPPLVSVLNKMDAVPERLDDAPDGVPISAKVGTNIDRLLSRVGEVLCPDDRTVDLLVPFSAIGALHAWTTEERVEVLEHTGAGIRVRARVSTDELRRLAAAGVDVSASGASPRGPR
jgi:GTP-binding protein HflX